MLDIFKTLIWVIIAFLFGVLACYSFKSVKPLQTQMDEIKNKSDDGNVKTEVILSGTNYTESLIGIYNALKSITVMSTIAAIISTITAILSIYI